MERDLRNPPDVHTPQAHYSHVARVGQTLYIAGQLALDPSGTVVGLGRRRRPGAPVLSELVADPRALWRPPAPPREDHDLHHSLGVSPAGGRRARRVLPRASIPGQHARRRAGPRRAALPGRDRGNRRSVNGGAWTDFVWRGPGPPPDFRMEGAGPPPNLPSARGATTVLEPVGVSRRAPGAPSAGGLGGPCEAPHLSRAGLGGPFEAPHVTGNR